MDLGFIHAGYTPIWANDNYQPALDNYRNVVGGTHAINADITPLLREGLWHIRPDVLIGGPPCQGFSRKGKLNPDDQRNQHIWNFLQAVEQMRPQSFIMENIKELGAGKRLAETRAQLLEKAESLGYQITLLVLNAADYGVPQNRHRMFLVGQPVGSPQFLPPPSTTNPVSVRTSLLELPAHGEPGNDTLCKAKVNFLKTPVLRVSPYAGMMFNGSGRPMDLDKPSVAMLSQMVGNSTPIIDQHTLETGEPHWIIGYHKHLTEGGDPFTGSAPERLRRITVEEAAHFQGFPVGVQWEGALRNRYSSIGNAVPPPLAYHLAISL